MTEWWDQDWSELPVGTPDTVRQVLERASSLFKMREDLSLSDKLHLFFMDVLVPYFDCMWEGMDQTAAHIVYRLSDRIPPEVRAQIGVYPRAVRRDQMFHVDKSATMDGWTTLEEWRLEWESYNHDIPPLQQLLPEGVTLQLEAGEPEPKPELQPAYETGNVIDIDPGDDQ